MVLEAALPNWDVWLDGAVLPPDLQGDAGTHRARVLWRILAPNQEGSDRALPPLWCERGFGAAHVGVLSGVGAAAPRYHRGNRVGPLAIGDPRGTVSECEREEGRDLLLWASYASEGGSGESEGAELPPREDRPAGARQTPRALLDMALQGRRSPRWGSKLGADRSASRTPGSPEREPDCLARRLRWRCILCARAGSRASFDRSRVGHRGGFSRLESGTITPLPPPPAPAPQKWPRVRADFLHVKKKREKWLWLF